LISVNTGFSKVYKTSIFANENTCFVLIIFKRTLLKYYWSGMKSNQKLIRFCIKATCASIGAVVGGFLGGAAGLALGEFFVPGLIEGIADTAGERPFEFAGEIFGAACGGLAAEEVAEVVNSDNSNIEDGTEADVVV